MESSKGGTRLTGTAETSNQCCINQLQAFTEVTPTIFYVLDAVHAVLSIDRSLTGKGSSAALRDPVETIERRNLTVQREI